MGSRISIIYPVPSSTLAAVLAAVLAATRTTSDESESPSKLRPLFSVDLDVVLLLGDELLAFDEAVVLAVDALA